MGLVGTCYYSLAATRVGHQMGRGALRMLRAMRAYEDFRDFTVQVKQARVADRVRPLVGLTTDIARSYPGRKIRVMLVDADHSFDGVRADFESWLPDMALGGLIIFHDYLMPEVARFIDSVVRSHPAIDRAPGLVVENVFAVTKKRETVASREHGLERGPRAGSMALERPAKVDSSAVLAGRN